MRRAAAAVCLVALAACGSAGIDAPKEWSETKAVFDLGGSTAAPIPVDRVLPDGRYWATVNEVLGSDDIVFTLHQARFGATCDSWAADHGMPEGCPNDYAVDTATHQVLTTSDVKWVSIAEASGPGMSYRVQYSTLVKLVRNEQVDVPTGYSWTSFPFIMTVEDGRAVGIDQYWVP